MAEPVPFKRPINWDRLRVDEALQAVRQRAANTSSVIIGDHAYERVDERTITQADVYTILRRGQITGQPVKENGVWKVIVTRRMAGRREAGVVTLLIEGEKLFVKTVEWMD